MAPKQPLPKTASRRLSTQKFLSETGRWRVPPLAWLGLAGAAVFGAFLAWVFLGDSRGPEDWWAQEVEPDVRRMGEAELREDYESALRSCGEAIRKAQQRPREFPSRLAWLKASQKRLAALIAREKEAGALAEKFRERTKSLPPGARERYQRAGVLVREGDDLVARVAGTGAEAEVRALLSALRSVPPPPERETWAEVKRKVESAVASREFARAMGLIGGFEGSPAPPEELQAARLCRTTVDSRATEYFWRRYPRGSSPEELARERGREKLLADAREDAARLKGCSPAAALEGMISVLSR